MADPHHPLTEAICTAAASHLFLSCTSTLTHETRHGHGLMRRGSRCTSATAFKTDQKVHHYFLINWQEAMIRKWCSTYSASEYGFRTPATHEGQAAEWLLRGLAKNTQTFGPIAKSQDMTCLICDVTQMPHSGLFSHQNHALIKWLF